MDANPIIIIIIALIGSGVLTTAINVYFGRKKISAEIESLEVETAAKLTEIATGLIVPLSNQVSTLQKQAEADRKALTRLEALVKKLTGGIRVLTDQLRNAGLDPAFELEERREGRRQQ